MLEVLSKCLTVGEIITEVKNFYNSFNNDYYIPAIYKEGSLIERKGKNSEFYAKLIIRPSNLELNESWIKMNDRNDFIYEPGKVSINDCVYNVVVTKKYYQNSLYTLNPNLYYSNDYIYEKIQDHKNVANLVYFENSFSTNEWPVLRAESDDKILILKQSLVESLCNYKLSVEFEYRSKDFIIKERDSIKGHGYYVQNNTGNDMTWIDVTLDLDLVIPVNNQLQLITNSISGGIRPINEHNWNDDIDAGLLVFKHACLKLLKKRYIIIELHMIDLFTKKSTLIDIVNDKVVFWEGEFNQLPFDIKKSLEPFNIKTNSKGIISKPMFEWQLNGNLYYDKFEYPYLKLGKNIVENYYDLACEMKCSLDLPNNSKELIEKINNILDIYNIKIDDLYKNENGFIYLKETLSKKRKPKKDECRQLFDYFCHLVLGVINYD